MIAAGQGIQTLCLFLQLTRGALDAHIVRLGLATPHDRPIRKGGAKAWSIPDTILAGFLRLIGVHPEVIGRALSQPRSANAVRTKLRRMGIRGPSRSELFKPDLASLHLPDTETIARLMLSQADFATTVRSLRAIVTGAPGQTASKAPRRAGKARTGGVIRSEGQRELPLMGIVAGREKDEATKPEVAAPVAVTAVPAKEELVDFNDLSWFRSLVGKNPLTNRVAVYVVGMLILGGLHYKEAARRLGLSEASYRTFRTNMDVPVDSDRSKAGRTFDEEAAKRTLLESDYELRLCMKSQRNWFWVKKSDKGTRLAPPYRTKERFIGERSRNKIDILTRKMLDRERSYRRAPFAKVSARLSA
jgi:hypothetical protein